MHTCGSHVINIEELAFRGTGTPDSDAGCVTGLSFVKATNQRWDDVGVFWVIVVTGAIHISRHHAAIIATILPVVTFTKLDASNLSNGIGLVGGF